MNLDLFGGIRGALFAGLSLILGLWIWSLHIRNDELRSALQTESQNAAELRIAASKWETDSLQCQVDLTRSQNQWADAQKTKEEQEQRAQELIGQSEKEAQKWKERWQNRAKTCDEALAQLDTMCPNLQDY